MAALLPRQMHARMSEYKRLGHLAGSDAEEPVGKSGERSASPECSSEKDFGYPSELILPSWWTGRPWCGPYSRGGLDVAGVGRMGAGSSMHRCSNMAEAAGMLRLRGGSRKNNKKNWKRKHKFECQVYNTYVRDLTIKKKARIDRLLMGKVARDMSKLSISPASSSETALMSAAGALQNKVEGVVGNTMQVVKIRDDLRLVNGKILNKVTKRLSYALTERAWQAAEKDYRLIGVPKIGKRQRITQGRVHRGRTSGKDKKSMLRQRKMEARFEVEMFLP